MEKVGNIIIKIIASEKSLANLFPEIAAEWFYELNGKLTPRDVSPGMNLKVFWKCTNENHAPWQCAIFHRTISKQRCPACSKEISYSKSLASTHSELCREWNYDNNGKLTPEMFHSGSQSKVHWICIKNPKHQWIAAIHKRVAGTGCPFCAHQKVHPDESLSVTNSELAAEWCWEKNAITPDMVYSKSNKRVWWKCSKNPVHVWKATVASRSDGCGCPYCSRRFADTENNFAQTHPQIASAWHYEKNYPFKPEDVLPGSNRKFWWICPNDSTHEWKTSVAKRTGENTQCPYCANRLINSTNCLAATHPHLVGEWHKEKNGERTPYNTGAGSATKIWWQCKRRVQHIWIASVVSRTSRDTNCPYCNAQSSKIEIRIFSELLHVFPDALHQDYSLEVECDILIPSLSIAVEFDGYYWHKDKSSIDIKKNQHLSENCVKLFRVREAGLPQLSRDDIIAPENYQTTSVQVNIVKELLTHMMQYVHDESTVTRIRQYMTRNEPANADVYDFMVSNIFSPSPENSLAFNYPRVADEWVQELNGIYTPWDVSCGSNSHAWWKCSLNSEHQWRATISSRVRGNGCPFCYSDARKNVVHKSANIVKKTSTYVKGVGTIITIPIEESLAYLRPTLIDEWHPTRNFPLTPENISAQSNIKVWWVCKQRHEWKTSISKRYQGQNCPYCQNKKISPENSIFATHPELLGEWNKEKNAPTTPEQVSSGSHMKAWWLCRTNPMHEWQAKICDRALNGTTCPHCRNRAVNQHNNLAVLYPEIAAEWDYEKNDPLIPSEIVSGSGKRVWWKCIVDANHRWNARVVDRIHGYYRCPLCKIENKKRNDI